MNKYIVLFIITLVMLLVYYSVRPDCDDKLNDKDRILDKQKMILLV